MGKKKNTPLLKEGTVRQFMKLADLKSLSDGFITEAYDDDATIEEQEDDFVPDAELDMAPEGEEFDTGEEADVSISSEEAEVIIGLGNKLEASGAGEEEALEEPLEEPPEDEEAMALEGVDLIDEDAIVKETLNRVATRLTNMSREQQLVESVARRVESRMYRRR